MAYVYKGKLTIDEVARYEKALQDARAQVKEAVKEARAESSVTIRAAKAEARQSIRRAEKAEARCEELTAENLSLNEENMHLAITNEAATRTIRNLTYRIEKSTATIERLRKAKKALQSRIIGLKKVRPVTESAAPIATVTDINDYSGPQGLAAAVAEAKRVKQAKKEAA